MSKQKLYTRSVLLYHLTYDIITLTNSEHNTRDNTHYMIYQLECHTFPQSTKICYETRRVGITAGYRCVLVLQISFDIWIIVHNVQSLFREYRLSLFD